MRDYLRVAPNPTHALLGMGWASRIGAAEAGSTPQPSSEPSTLPPEETLWTGLDF